MEKLQIGKIIFELRKVGKLTQEQLANEMNVSTAAVSKWESGASYPDIALLPQLARFFGVSIDELLQFHSNPSEVEEAEIFQEFGDVVDAGKWQQALELYEMFSSKYKNAYSLKFKLACHLKMAQDLSEDESQDIKKQVLNKVRDIFNDIAKNCNDKQLAEAAYMQLSIGYSMEENYDLAMEMLERIPNPAFDKKSAKATILMNQGKLKESRTLLETQLLENLNSIEAALNGLAYSYYREDLQKAERYMNLAMDITRLFGEKERSYSMLVHYLSLLQFFVEHKHQEKSEIVLSKMTEFFRDEPSEEIQQPWYLYELKLGETPSYANKIKDMLQVLFEEEDFEFLSQTSEFQILTQVLKGKV